MCPAYIGLCEQFFNKVFSFLVLFSSMRYFSYWTGDCGSLIIAEVPSVAQVIKFVNDPEINFHKLPEDLMPAEGEKVRRCV
jgi:hypothetical protein